MRVERENPAQKAEENKDNPLGLILIWVFVGWAIGELINLYAGILG